MNRVVGLLLTALLLATGGCAAAGRALSPPQRAVQAAAEPILKLDPQADWTAAFNQLVEIGPEALDWLMMQPPMTRPVAPDDLRAMVHHSLVRLLSEPRSAPKLSILCLDTTGGLLSFEPKVRGRALGPVYQPSPQPPRRWHDLYTAEFDHALGREADAERDRRSLLDWYGQRRRDRLAAWGATRLSPRFEHVVLLLRRRPANLWTFDPHDAVTLCSAAQSDPPAMLKHSTYDYNVVRSACIWLGSSSRDQQRMQLIELLASPNETVAYNARFALQFCPDPRIREVLDRYNRSEPPPPTHEPEPREDSKAPWSL